MKMQKLMTFSERLETYMKTIAKEYRDPFYALGESEPRLHYAIINGCDWARYYITKEMRERATKCEEATFTYDDKLCLYRDRKNDDYRLILELPIAYDSYTKECFKLEAGSDKGYLHSKLNPVVRDIKYLTGTCEDGKKVVAAIQVGMHRDLVMVVEDALKQKVTEISGGRFKIVKDKWSLPKVGIYSCSRDFGRADHEFVSELLNKNGLRAQVLDGR